jgi:hypothetical protein
MTTSHPRPATVERLQYALGPKFPRQVIEQYVIDHLEKFEEAARFIRQDEEENAEFYRMLGER